MMTVTAPVISEAVATKLRTYPVEDVYDGCTAAAHAAYGCTDLSFIYPITPSTPMAEVYEVWSAAKRLNVFGRIAEVRQLQSEAGAAGAVHGGLSTGSLTTTFTASQGLLLMIPPMYKIAGELLPCVFHVSARAIAGQALSIFGDHSDVMAVRQTGWALLASASVQEAQDIAVISHMATLRARVPFVHFFDGFRTSHELQKIKLVDYMTMRNLLDHKAIQDFRANALNPTHPMTKGTAQGPEVYFQNVETSNPYYIKCHEHVIEAMQRFGEVVGRKYEIFEYFGSPTATNVIVIMGSGAQICQEAITYLMKSETDLGSDVGVLNVRLFRPWSREHFMAKLPETVRRVCVMDRVKEPGAYGEPLFLDVAACLQSSDKLRDCVCVGGRYGLGSRDFTPAMVLSIFENLKSAAPRHGFTVGINDDLTHLSLDYSRYMKLDCVPKGTTQCMFWGMGSDGTVGANKNVIKILGMNTPLQVQGYFAYSAHKAGGLTLSHLRFGPEPITSSYLLQASDYVAVHRAVYLKKYPGCFDTLKEKATAVINCEWSDEQLMQELSGQMKRQLALNDVRLFAIDANKVAAENGMGRRINNVLMTSFFKVSGVLPFEQAIGLFKTAIQKTYGKKGMHIVEANWKCVDAAVDATREVKYNKAEWLSAKDTPTVDRLEPSKKMPQPPAFVSNVMVNLARGEDLPVSAFAPFQGGVLPPGTAGYEKRAIAMNVPVVDMDKCSQCNQCSFVCPHAAIRPFVMDDDEMETAPESFLARKCKAPASLAQYKYRIQVSPLDCTGCELCFIACPDKALTMMPLDKVAPKEDVNWNFAQNVTEKTDEVEEETRMTLKGSQFFTPMMEFSGACEGCGETPYVKLLTQLFGERLIIANATGCSSIWGASYPANAYTVNQKGFGPAWANSLFEDNAEYGFGMCIATASRRQHLKKSVEALLSDEAATQAISQKLRDLLAQWLLHFLDASVCQRTFEGARELLAAEREAHPLVADVDNNKDLLPKISQWIVGGDGWAYDIGFGGLDHVVASGVNLNFLIMDTEVYSNTGGQTSKATPIGAVHKFAAGGKIRNKKDLGVICMEYGDVYVASIASSANMTHSVRALVEAESYDGVSVVMAYAPCIEHQYLKPFNLQIEHCKLAVNSGYWPLYRYDPRRLEQNEPCFQLDSKKLKASVIDMVRKENRFVILKRANPDLAADLEIRLKEWVEDRFKRYEHRAIGYNVKQAEENAIAPELFYTILFGTDTGNAENVANRIAAALKERQLGAKVCSMEDVTLEDAAACVNLVCVISTTGQGEFPPNAKAFCESVLACDNQNTFEQTHFAVMGLGDSGYVFFNQAAQKLDAGLERLGGHRILDVGLGDDQHEEGFEGALSDWMPALMVEIKAPQPLSASTEPLPTRFTLEDAPTCTAADLKHVAHEGMTSVSVKSSRRLTAENYDVDVRHIELDLAETKLRYSLGDSLAVMPENDLEEVRKFCAYMNFEPDRIVYVRGKDAPRKYQAAFAHPLSVQQIFCEVLDVFGKPPRNFYENLFRYATDPAEQKELQALITNKTLLKEWVQGEHVHFFDVIRKFKSLKFTVEQMIDLVPMLKPRYYSIASSQAFVGEKNLHLCIGIVEDKPSTGEIRFGQLTGYLRRSPKFLCATVKPTAFCLPPTHKHPIIVAGMGTGLAPFRAFIQHRAWLKQQGKEVGPVSVYMGCRHEKKDYLYREELEHYRDIGVISELEVAFSRDQAHKIYVMDKMRLNSKNFYERLVTQDAYIYLCGAAKAFPADVRNTVASILVKEGGFEEEQAFNTITKWQLKGKYNIEAW